MTNYVVGFMFNDKRNKVLLIQKEKPDWQKGYWNGIGGKIEKDESAIIAMCREFREETGVVTSASQWQSMVILQTTMATVHFFCSFSSNAVELAKTMERERVEAVDVDMVALGLHVIPNLKWLIPFCLNINNHLNRNVQCILPIFVVERDIPWIG